MRIKNPYILLPILLIYLLVYSTLFANINTSKTELLANFGFVENSRDITFQHKPYLINIIGNENDGYDLVTTKFSDNLKNSTEHSALLKDLIKRSDIKYYNHQVVANDQEIFVLISAWKKNNEADGESENLEFLVSSADGVNWSLKKEFIGPYGLIQANGHAIGIRNYQDEHNYYISHDQAKSWQTIHLPDHLSPDWGKHTGAFIANNRLFLVTEPQSIYSTQIFYSSENGKLIESDFSNLKQITVSLDSKQQFQFLGIKNIFSIKNKIVALASYYTNTETEKLKNFFWLSEDKGKTWSLFNFNLNDDEEIEQISEYNEQYHIITSHHEPYHMPPETSARPIKKFNFNYYIVNKRNLSNRYFEPMPLKPFTSFQSDLGELRNFTNDEVADVIIDIELVDCKDGFPVLMLLKLGNSVEFIRLLS